MVQESSQAKKITQYPDFMIVWLGQFISVFGSQITAFALSIWIFHETGSITVFGLVIAAQLGPAILLSPLAGVLVDKKSRRLVMLACDMGMLVACLPLLYWAANDTLDLIKVICLTPLLSLFAMTHNIAYSSSIAILVPKSQFATANGMVQLANNSSAVVVPVIAVAILQGLGIRIILLLNLLTYFFAIASLLWVRFPAQQNSLSQNPSSLNQSKQNSMENTEKAIDGNISGLLNQQKFGFEYILKHNRVLLVLLSALFCVSVLNGLVQVLFRPMILLAHSPMVIGWLVSIAGFGGLCGAIFSGLFVSRFDKSSVLVTFSYIAGFTAMVCGFTTNNYVMGVVAFVFSFAIPIVMVASQTLWQLLVPVEMQGKVFATRTFMASLVLMLTIIVAPQISEHVLEPLMNSSNAFSELMAPLMEIAPGRGMGMMFVICGLGVMLMTALIQLRLRGFRQLLTTATQSTASKPSPVAESAAS